MSEFFLELFSEEIPSNLQQNLREDLLKSFNDLFLEKSILFKKSSSYSTPNRLVVLFECIQKTTKKSFEWFKIFETSPSCIKQRNNHHAQLRTTFQLRNYIIHGGFFRNTRFCCYVF